MKKILIGVFGIIATCSALAFGGAAPTTGVLGSVHDMRASAGAVDIGGNDRVCAFCHTPHHAYQGTNPSDYYPLWSRQLDVQSFTPYASSTINAIDWAADIAIGPTRLCMSCHDGTIAPDQHYGNIGVVAGLSENIPGMGVGSTWMGGAGVGAGVAGLSNDHPVGFNYDTVATGPASGNPDGALINSSGAQEDPWIRQASDLLTYEGGPYSIKVADRLFVDPSDGTRYMTCATCHDVHNKKNADLATSPNYLVLAPQKDSALCLTCHIK
jgi:hypothetical protein